MLNYSKFVYKRSAPAGNPSAKPLVKPKPAFQIAPKTPKALKAGIGRLLKKLTKTEKQVLNRYVKFVLNQYELKLEKKYNKSKGLPSLTLVLKFLIKDRMAMRQISIKLRKLKMSFYYIDRYVKVLKYRLAKEYKKLYSKKNKPKGKKQRDYVPSAW